MEEKRYQENLGCSALMFNKLLQQKKTTHFKNEIWKLVKTLTQTTLRLMQKFASPIGNSQNMMQTKKRKTFNSRNS